MKEAVEENLIQEEIEDLKGYLNDIPESLKATGAFAAYDARLSMLQEQLASVRLQTALASIRKQYKDLPAVLPAGSLSDRNFIRDLKFALLYIEHAYSEAAQSYSRRSLWLEAAVLILLVLIGASFILSTRFTEWIILFSAVGAVFSVIEIILRFVNRPLKAQKLADNMAALRMELDLLSAKAEEEERLEPREVNESAIRINRILDEIKIEPSAPSGKTVHRAHIQPPP